MDDVVSAQVIPDHGIQVSAEQVRGAALLCHEGNVLGCPAMCVLEDNSHAVLAPQ